jgi:hypothetical protein
MSGDSKNNFGYQGNNWASMPSIAESASYSSVEFPKGYKATPAPDDNFKEPYDYYENKLSGPSMSIERIRLQIKAQKPGTISALADYWVKVVQLLDTVKQTVSSNADALHGGSKGGFGGWQSPAADEFLRWGPGATLYSVEQWIKAAQANVDGLRQLVDGVLAAHDDIDKAWDSYVAEAQADKAKMLKDWGGPDPSSVPKDLQKDLGGEAARFMEHMYQSQTGIWRKWSVVAQGVAYKLSQKYYAQLEGKLASGRGTRFEGPSNAVVDPPSPMRSLGSPPGGPPGRAPGSAPGGPGSAPPGAPPGRAPRQSRANVGAPPGSAPPPTMLQHLARAAQHAQDLALVPPPEAHAPVPLPLSSPDSLLITPGLARLLGLGGGPAATALTRPSNLGLKGTFGLTRNATSDLGAPTLDKSGVLRSTTTPGGQTEPPGSTAGLRGPSANRMGGMGGGEGPEGMPGRGGRRAGVFGKETNRPGAPGLGEEEPFGSPGARVPGTTSPVLGGRRTFGSGGNPMSNEPSLRGGPTRPGTTPSVFKGGNRSQRRTGGPVDDDELTRTTSLPGATAPVLGSPAQRLRGQAPVESLDEIPRALRAAGASADRTAASELGSRRRGQGERDAHLDLTGEQHEDGPRVIGDEEAWVVQTPGGAVLNNRPEQQQVRQVEPRPALGGGNG